MKIVFCYETVLIEKVPGKGEDEENCLDMIRNDEEDVGGGGSVLKVRSELRQERERIWSRQCQD